MSERKELSIKTSIELSPYDFEGSKDNAIMRINQYYEMAYMFYPDVPKDKFYVQIFPIGYDHDFDICMCYKRQETEEEYQVRLKNEQEAKRKEREKLREQYEKLKEMFGE